MSNEENINQIPEDKKPDSPPEIIMHLAEIPAIAAIEQPITINPKPETETMEIHHHPQVEKKNFKEYVLEGLMIFLAVTMGFIAENIREHLTDASKENDYIISMIEDAKTDTFHLQESITANILRAKRLDTLAAYCLNYDMTGKDDAEIHRLFSYGLVHPDFITPTERTMQQLKNAGGMRLIRRASAVDSIILYDDMSKKLADQQAYYELYQNKVAQIGAQLINFKNLKFQDNDPLFKNVADSSRMLINRDKLKLIEFGNMVDSYHIIVVFYYVLLQEMNEHATHLIKTLQKEYHLPHE
jgi:hypothetical protein